MPPRVNGSNKNSNSNGSVASANSSLFRQQRRLDGIGRAANDTDDDAEVDVRHNKPVVLMSLVLTMELSSLALSQVLDGSVKSSFAALASLDGNYGSDQHRAMIFDLALSGGGSGGLAGGGMLSSGGDSSGSFRGPLAGGVRANQSASGSASGSASSPGRRRSKRRQRNHTDSLSR